MALYYGFFIALPHAGLSGKKAIANYTVILCPVLLLVSACAGRIAGSGRFCLTFLDTSGGTVHLALPGNKNILIDGCDASARFDEGKNIVSPYLWRHGVTKLDAIFLMQSGYRNIRGLVSVLERFPLPRIYYTGSLRYTDDETGEFVKVLKDKKIRLRYAGKGDSMEYGPVSVEVFYPGKGRDRSALVFKLRYLDFSFLFSGDISKSVQERLADEDIKSDILYIAGRGKKKVSDKFLSKISPKYAIIPGKVREEDFVKQFGKDRVIDIAKDGPVSIWLERGKIMLLAYRQPAAYSR